MTNDLIRRVTEHKADFNPNSYTSKNSIKRLVYFEVFDDPETAIAREKFVKNLTRKGQIKLIERDNPDLWELFKGDRTIGW